jgi:hypothetical protein
MPFIDTTSCDASCQELIRWSISIVVPALFGFIGVIVGAWLSGRRERTQRRLSYMEKQLKDFYSPMLGLRNEIEMHSSLRVRIYETANTVWQELCRQNQERGVEVLTKFTDSRGEEFKRIIDYDNGKFQEELLPAYRQMAKLFREGFWLAEPETRSHYANLIEFVEVWERWFAKSIPGEVVAKLGHSEDRLQSFYKHLRSKHDELRIKLSKRSV